MWADRDVGEQFQLPDHLVSHLTHKQRENGTDHHARQYHQHNHVPVGSREYLDGSETARLAAGSREYLDGGETVRLPVGSREYLDNSEARLAAGSREYLDGGEARLMSHHRENMLPHLGDQEAMMVPTPLTPMVQDTGMQEELKLPTRKEHESLLKKYAKKLGLNDRGCYVAIGLAIIIFFLLVIIIALLVSWPASGLRYTGPIELCKTSSCLEASVNLVHNLNTSLEPCRDIYGFACGGWLTREGIPEGRSTWGVLQSMEHNMLKEQSRIVSKFSHQPSQYNSIEWKVQHFFESCKTLEYIESDREKPLMQLINNLGGWDVLRSFNLYNWDPHRVLRELHAEYMVNAFFQVDIVPDYKVAGHNIIRISPGGLGLPDKSFYHRFPNDSTIQAYQTFLKDAAQLFGAPSPEAHKFAVDMFNFEKRIAEITPGLNYLKNPNKVNNRMKVKDLRTMSMNVPWLEVLKACYPNVKLSEETSVLVVSPQYAADIAVIMSTTDRGSLNNYLIWQLVNKYMPFLSSAFTEAVDLYTKFLTGVDKPVERWEYCGKVTRQFFGHLMDSITYSQQAKVDERIGVTQRMFTWIRDAVAQRVSVSNNYDYSTRQALIDKLHSMSIQVGTPDFIRDAKYLKIMYKEMQVQKTNFFQNIQYGMHFLRRRQEHALISPGEETRWLSALFQTRVTHVPAANKVVVPEYLLAPPLFNPSYPSNINLGGLGVMIAEAVLDGTIGRGSAFTATGGLVDAQEPGNYTLSRSGSDAAALFRRSATCLSSSWTRAGIDTPDQLEKCASTSAISVAALEIALAALDESLSAEGAQLLPTFEDRDPQTMFLLHHAQSLCSARTLQQRDLDRTVGDRLLPKEQLLGSFSHVSEFKHFFFCSGVGSDSEECGSVL